jgi:A/G-specific adenine glycosylase
MKGTKSNLVKRLCAWYRAHRRDLPWRAPTNSPLGTRPDPYRVLVSEAMLQQTQVATVVPYFLQFLQEFPTIRALATADEQRVLRLWQGLGYYSRARNLLRAARMVVQKFDGVLPAEAARLRELPGVGRYTAGAIASLAFGRHEPVVDGNVARVLCRLDRIEADPRSKPVQDKLWQRAAELLPRTAVGEFNSALMELGATICTPRAPRCLLCPIRAHCQAFAGSMQDRIPRPRRRRETPLLTRQTFCIRRINRAGEQWLIEQRPERGRWAGMWQFPTRPATRKPMDLSPSKPRRIGTVTHALTHRRYRFDVYICDACDGQVVGAGSENPPQRRWVRLDGLDAFPLPRPHLKIVQMLRHNAPDGSNGRYLSSRTGFV